MNRLRILILALVAISPLLPAQEKAAGNFDDAAKGIQSKLDASIAELNKIRERIASETLPLSEQLSELENELSNVRLEYQQTTRLLDNNALSLTTLRGEIKSRKEEAAYLSNLLSEYVRVFESRLHIAELQRYSEPLEAAKLALENTGLSEQELFDAQSKMLSVSLERLEDSLGGSRFDGAAVDTDGKIKPGTFILVGPAAIFRAHDNSAVGIAEQRLGSLEPTITPFGEPTDIAAATNLIEQSHGTFPLDPTMGNAHKVEKTEETFLEHVKKGGPLMYPIFAIAGAALLVALFKWLSMVFISTPSRRKIRALLSAISARDQSAIEQATKKLRGPVGRMLATGVEHIREPRELIEEVMYENVLTTRLKLNSMLPFISITASSAPLLGLLGTVTGIMNTFTLMTVFGTGDIKTLSSGISEALITTEFGLYVAIPSLLLYAFLSRKAKGVVDEMEKAAVAFLNQVAKTQWDAPPKESPAPTPIPAEPEVSYAT